MKFEICSDETVLRRVKNQSPLVHQVGPAAEASVGSLHLGKNGALNKRLRPLSIENDLATPSTHGG